jgi:hypothetical protein
MKIGTHDIRYIHSISTKLGLFIFRFIFILGLATYLTHLDQRSIWNTIITWIFTYIIKILNKCKNYWKTYICTYRWFEDDYHKFRKAVLHIATLDSLLSLASVARLHGYCRFVSALDSLLSLASVARLHGYCRFVSTLDSLLSLASVARLHGYCRFVSTLDCLLSLPL